MEMSLEQRETKNLMSYQVLKYIGAILLSVSQFINLYYVYSSFYGIDVNFSAWFQLIGLVSQIGLPLILISTLAAIMNNKKKIFWYMGGYAIGAVSFIFLEQLAIITYLRIISTMVNYELSSTMIAFLNEIIIISLNQFVSLNVFVDLFIVSLFYFFLFYKPKKYVSLFRCLIIIPIACLITSYVLSTLNKLGTISLNFYVTSLLTSKKPSAYVIFLSMLLYLKIKNLKNEEFKSSSRDFQVFMGLVIVAVSIIEGFLSMIPNARAFSVGTNYALFLSLPFIFLFDYKKEIKHRWVGMTIPGYYFISYGTIFLVYTYLLLELLNGIPFDRLLPYE